MSEAPERIDRLVKVYIKMRDKRDEIRHEMEAKISEIDEQMDAVKATLLENCESVGINSLRTPFGRVVRSIKTRYWTSDWEMMHNFIQENNALGLLEKRIHQTNMKTYLEENPDKMPPGLNSDREYDLVVYRK